MADVTVHYTDGLGKLCAVRVTAFHPDEVFWIGARKAKMAKEDFKKAIIKVDTEGKLR